MSQNFSNANNLMKNGLYAEALAIYKNIESSDSFWLDKVAANIALINKRLNQEKKYSENAKNTIITKDSTSKITSVKNEEKNTKIYLEDIYRQIKESNVKTNFNYTPMVSIAMTAHNTEEYIESSIHSLLNQTYKNIEIIVVDDQSTDNTQKIVQRLSKTDKRVQYKQLATNLGTYYAKNYAISIAKGDYIFFQDSDDICHPRRIEIMLDQLINADKKIIRGAYCRLDPDTERIMPVNGLTSKLGLITLGVKKEVFKEIGYFHCTTKASDDEFYQRACKFLGKHQIESNTLPLYYNTYREGSLFADMVTLTQSGDIIQKPSLARQNYLEKFTALHKKNDSSEKIQKFFRFPQIRNSILVMEEMTKLANPIDLVIYNVCSIPSRENSLKRTINSIINQCDQINVYLDGYKETPSFLTKYSKKCNITHSTPYKSHRDNGKYLALEELIINKINAYYFTIDDDILYPPDYTNHLIKKINHYNKKTFVGIHGVILKNTPSGYFLDRRIVYNFTKSLETDKLVNLLGTGTSAFHTSAITKFSISTLEETGMVDIFIGVFCKKNNIPQIAVSRPENWLLDLNPTPEQTLYHEFKDNDSKQSTLIIKNSPWGYKSISLILNKYMEQEKSNPSILKIPALSSVTRNQ